ncbi:hypothetical protein BH11MYX1_BH11MYX1_36580 [soil metagenome]
MSDTLTSTPIRTPAPPPPRQMSGAAFRHWERSRESREGGAVARWLSVLAAGAALAAVTAWRADATTIASASHVWLGGTLAAFALTFMRTPFQIYWRKDAALRAQLPIGGTILCDGAFRRCTRAALATTLVAILGAVPFVLLDAARVGAATRTLQAMPIAGDPVPRFTPLELFGTHAALAATLGLVAACFISGVSIYAASLVASSKNLLQVATAIGGAPARDKADQPLTAPGMGSAGAVLGALPGFAASIVFVLVFLVSPALVNGEAHIDPGLALGLVAGISLALIVSMRQKAAATMGSILRDVSALDRQRLATLELHPPTAIERGVAKLVGSAGLAYAKDARLMRRRYPMAYALGALAFLVLAIIGLVQPSEPAWLIATLAGVALYAISLAHRLTRPPIELARLASTLPIRAASRSRAKLAWLATWVAVFVAVPAVFAIVRAT